MDNPLKALQEATAANPGKVTILMLANVYIGGVPLAEIKTFNTRTEREAWVRDNLARFGGFPTVYELE